MITTSKSDKAKKVSIIRADNGYIVRVLKQDVGIMEERYDTPTLVFPSLDELVEYLNLAMGGDK
jgi:hypothetical protein